MDTHGLHHQFLPPRCRPLRDNMMLAGRAKTALEPEAGSPKQNLQRIFSERGWDSIAGSKSWGLFLIGVGAFSTNPLWVALVFTHSPLHLAVQPTKDRQRYRQVLSCISDLNAES